MSATKYIAWIPARGGSKRLPGKNVMEFCGYPLIYHSIHQAQACDFIEDVYVSTDDDAIESVSLRFGAKVVRRPQEFATDTATTGSAARHLLSDVGVTSNSDLKGLITLQPTQPLRSKELLHRCVKQFNSLEGKHASLITVSVNNRKIGKLIDGNFQPLTYRPEQRSQDLEATYFENGVVYISRPEIVLDKSLVFDENAKAIVTDDIFSRIDIDDRLDFEVGEFIFSKYHSKN